MKKLLNFVKIYLLLLILVVVFLVRLFLYNFPPAKQENFSKTILITQPIFIEENQVIIKSSNFTVKTYDFNADFGMGDLVTVNGTRYYKTIYPDTLEYAGASSLKPIFKIKSMFLTASNQMLVEPYASLVNGMLFGTDPVILPTFKEQLINAGVIHIIVVSGFNISILFTFVGKLLGKYSIKVKTAIASILVVTYCLVVGLEPPVLRALVMGLMVGYARAFGYARDVLYILLVTILLMLIYNPEYATNVSFLLTVTASLGLIILAEPISYICNTNRVFKGFPVMVKESITSSFVAQIYVLPLVAYFFGRISLVGFIVNPVVVWVVPFVMLISFVFICLYLVGLGPFIQPFLFILYTPLMFFVDVVISMTKLPFSNVELTTNKYIMITSYILVAVFSYLVIKTHKSLLRKNEQKSI